MVDDVDGDWPALALDEQLGHELRRDRGRRYPIDPLPTVRLSPRNEVIASHKSRPRSLELALRCDCAGGSSDGNGAGGT